MNTSGEFDGKWTKNRFTNFNFLKIDVVKTFIIIYVIGVTIVRNAIKIRQ